MITRIVKMHFKKSEVPLFLSIFSVVKKEIAAFEGCLGVELFQDVKETQILFTSSSWENLQALENYRNSELFKSTWNKTKVLFQEKAEAWSLEKVN